MNDGNIINELNARAEIINELRDIIYDLIDRPSDKKIFGAHELLIKSKPFTVKSSQTSSPE